RCKCAPARRFARAQRTGGSGEGDSVAVTVGGVSDRSARTRGAVAVAFDRSIAEQSARDRAEDRADTTTVAALSTVAISVPARRRRAILITAIAIRLPARIAVAVARWPI